MSEILQSRTTFFPAFNINHFPERHRIDPPHRPEPEDFARMERGFWEGAEKAIMD